MLVTHYQRLLNYIVPDYVHVMDGGRIIKTGGKELALELEHTRLRLGRAKSTRPRGRCVTTDDRRRSRDLEQSARRLMAQLDRWRSSPAVAWLKALRAEAVERVGVLTVPTTRDEEWRFTDISALNRDVVSSGCARRRSLR